MVKRDDLPIEEAETLALAISQFGNSSFEWGHGGLRPGAGRKRKAQRPNVGHRPRPHHARRYPAHVTIPFLKVAGSLRTQVIFKALREIFHTRKNGARGALETSFQVVQYSVQSDHIHLLVEAIDRETFSAGMRSLNIRMALKINRLLGRKKGKVQRDRYHRRDLFNAKSVRTALRYVLLNGAKHGVVHLTQLDPFSSAHTFDGWREVMDPTWRPKGRGDPAPAQMQLDEHEAVLPWTRLLRTDWRELGLISPREAERWHHHKN